jgi:hypothetical protein
VASAISFFTYAASTPSFGSPYVETYRIWGPDLYSPRTPLNMRQAYLIYSSFSLSAPLLLSASSDLRSSSNWGSKISATRLSSLFTEQMAAAQRLVASKSLSEGNAVLLAKSAQQFRMSCTELSHGLTQVSLCPRN